MAHSTDTQFNVLWDVLQTTDNDLLDPLNDVINEPAVFSSLNVKWYSRFYLEVYSLIIILYSILQNLYMKI